MSLSRDLLPGMALPLPSRAAAGGRVPGLVSEPLRQFLQAARSAGMRVSAAEGIDAARAVQVVG